MEFYLQDFPEELLFNLKCCCLSSYFVPLGHINYFYTSKLNQEIGVNSLLINIGGDVYQSETLIQCIFNFACTASVSRCNQRFFN